MSDELKCYTSEEIKKITGAPARPQTVKRSGVGKMFLTVLAVLVAIIAFVYLELRINSVSRDLSELREKHNALVKALQR